MKSKCQIFVRFVFIMFAFVYFGCSSEQETQHAHALKKPAKARFIKGLETLAIQDRLEKEIFKSRINGYSFRDSNTGEIDYSEIMEVIDTTGVTNFTFRVINHPDDNEKTFHNLVFTETDGQSEVALIKYQMSENFTQYYNDNPLITDFKGTISLKTIGNASPCGSIVVIHPTPAIPNSSGPTDNPGPPSPINGTGGDGCTSVSLTYNCEDCGSNYYDWPTYKNSVCGNGSYGLIVLMSFQNCRSALDPCNPIGNIGILPNKYKLFYNEMTNEQKQWWNDPANVEKATEINDYLNENTNDGVIDSDALEFAYLAIDAYQNNLEVDFDELYVEVPTPDDAYEYTGPTEHIPSILVLENGDSVSVTFGTTNDGTNADKPVAVELINSLMFALNDANNNLPEAGKITSISIYSTTNGQHTGPNHYSGTALDINKINGVRMQTSGVTKQIKKLQESFDKFPYIRENFGPSFKHKYSIESNSWNYNFPVPGHSDHIHISIRKP